MAMLYQGKPFPPDNDNLDRFQKVIEEQAAYWGMTVERHKRFLDNICELQELAEMEDWTT